MTVMLKKHVMLRLVRSAARVGELLLRDCIFELKPDRVVRSTNVLQCTNRTPQGLGGSLASLVFDRVRGRGGV